jgi:hypothetical protein
MSDVNFTTNLPISGTRVVFGKRLRGIDLFNLDADPQGNIPTQYQLLIARGAVVEFGELKTVDAKGKPQPVPLPTLLALDTSDFEELIDAHNKFLGEGLAGREPEYTSESEVKLAFGYESEGLTYNRVRFGARTRGYDLVEADKKSYVGLKRDCFLIGKEIVQLTTDDGSSVLDGPVEIQIFEQLDGADIIALRAASFAWRNSFRKSERGVQREVGAQHPAVGGTNGVE